MVRLSNVSKKEQTILFQKLNEEEPNIVDEPVPIKLGLGDIPHVGPIRRRRSRNMVPKFS